ncbi:MAG: DapH/DapD/GlmU-related protein [Acidobacteriota bacterium]
MNNKTPGTKDKKPLIRGKDTGFWINNLNIAEDISTLPLDEQEKIIIRYQTEYYMGKGVILKDYSGFYIEGLPAIGEGSIISTGVFIDSDSTIGKSVEIYPNSYIEASEIGDTSVILPGSVIRGSVVKVGAQIGPYSHLRNGVVIENGAKVGNFTEMKKTIFGKSSKAMHLSYVGDAIVGEDVNIGAGTITCNYDGVNKNQTIIKDRSFIGSGTELIAPVTIEENCYVAAGSTINEDVPPDSLAVARQRQRVIKGWSKRKKRKKSD